MNITYRNIPSSEWSFAHLCVMDFIENYLGRSGHGASNYCVYGYRLSVSKTKAGNVVARWCQK